MKKAKLLAVILTGLMAVSYGDDSGDYERYDIPFKGEEKLIVDLDFAFGSLNIRPSDNNEYIMRAGMNYSSEALKPSIVYEISGSKGKLELGTKNTNHDYSLKEFNKMKKDANENDWRLEFIKNIPTTYSIEFGAGDGNFDFSGMRIENMDFELAMGDVELYFNEPNHSRMKKMNVETGLGSFEARGLGNANISDFSLECGLGSSYLVFDGDFKGTVRAEVSVGLGSVDIEIPRNVAVEIQSESSFLSSVDFDDFEQIEKGLYRSANWRTNTSGRIIIEIAVGMGSASVEWIR